MLLSYAMWMQVRLSRWFTFINICTWVQGGKNFGLVWPTKPLEPHKFPQSLIHEAHWFYKHKPCRLVNRGCPISPDSQYRFKANQAKFVNMAGIHPPTSGLAWKNRRLSSKECAIYKAPTSLLTSSVADPVRAWNAFKAESTEARLAVLSCSLGSLTGNRPRWMRYNDNWI